MYNPQDFLIRFHSRSDLSFRLVVHNFNIETRGPIASHWQPMYLSMITCLLFAFLAALLWGCRGAAGSLVWLSVANCSLNTRKELVGTSDIIKLFSSELVVSLQYLDVLDPRAVDIEANLCPRAGLTHIRAYHKSIIDTLMSPLDGHQNTCKSSRRIARCWSRSAAVRFY